MENSNFSTLLIVGYAVVNLLILHFGLYYQRSIRRRYSKNLWKQHQDKISVAK